MRLPAPLSRHNPNAYKNQFGHVLILAGSSRMLGAAALCGLSAFRTGAGLVTIGVAKSLNLTLQSKITNEIMTLPLKESSGHISFAAWSQVKTVFSKYQAVAIGPGMGQEHSTKKFVLKVIRECPLPLVVDADALNILSSDLNILNSARGPRILTPHPGEMARLTGLSQEVIGKDRRKIARDFACQYGCVLVLKGHHTVVASSLGEIYINKTGNSGMATAGSGDVLTGMIVALLGQGVLPYEAARVGVYLHGKAGDSAIKTISAATMIASDLLSFIPKL